MASGDLISRVADKETLDKVLDEVLKISSVVVEPSTFDWEGYFRQKATGELFATKFYSVNVSQTVDGTKMHDSVGLSCTPSAEDTKGNDDFSRYNAFWIADCNFIMDDTCSAIPTAIEGQTAFKRTGKVDVGVLTPPLYYGVRYDETDDSYTWYLSDVEQPKADLTLTLMPHCKNRKTGEPLGYGIVAKYYAGEIDGKIYGSSGLAPKNHVSYQTLHTLMQARGTGYEGAGAERSIYLKLMLRIKYAKSSSQAVFKGNTSNNLQYEVAEASEGNYVVLTEAQAGNLYVGETVSIGDNANSNTDRNNSGMKNIADKIRITKIDGANVYVEATDLTIPEGSYISTMPLHSGQTDNVKGNDGYVKNDGKHSFKLQGIEEGIGAWLVSCNEMINKESATVNVFYNKNTGSYTTSIDTVKSTWKECGRLTRTNSDDFWIGDVAIDEETGTEVPVNASNGNGSGTGDRCYFGGTSTGIQEHLSRGSLGNESSAGLSNVYCGNALSYSHWSYVGCVS
jgi:hypothetical protein